MNLGFKLIHNSKLFMSFPEVLILYSNNRKSFVRFLSPLNLVENRHEPQNVNELTHKTI